jgi:hypothetical protein
LKVSFCGTDSSSSCLFWVYMAFISFSYFSFVPLFSFSTKAQYGSSASSCFSCLRHLLSLLLHVLLKLSVTFNFSEIFVELMVISVFDAVAFDSCSSTFLLNWISWRRRCWISFMITADLGTWLLDFETDVPTIESTLSGWPLDVLLRVASTTTEWTEDGGVLVRSDGDREK